MGILDDFANMSGQAEPVPHFAGVNTELLADVTEGSAILVSYADIMLKTGGTSAFWRKSLLPRLEDGAYRSVILDSGAYTVCSQGITIDLGLYVEFIREYGHLFDQVIGLDVIGDAEGSKLNLAEMRVCGIEAMPVFHQGEDWAELAEILAWTDGTIGVGFARTSEGRLQHGKQANARFLREFFRRSEGRAVHGFAMNQWMSFPFATTDSTTWVSEGCALRRQAEEAPRPHGVGGALATMLGGLTRGQAFRMAVASYGSDGPQFDAELVEDHSIGQARTVLRRANTRRMVAC